jgi:hypothetical protein
MRSRTTIPVSVALCGLLAAACGGGEKKVAVTTTTTTPATTAPSTTTVPAPPPAPVGLPAGASPLTGLDAAGRAGRPVLLVKIDNAPKARPQAGLNQADVVVEEAVEGGVTRFAALFHSQEADPVGPVRSARTTDIQLATPLNRPLFAYSGANADFQNFVRAAPVVNVGVDAFPGDYRRDGKRPAPYNLFSSTPKLFSHVPPGAGGPPAMFSFRPFGQPLVGGQPTAGVRMEYRGRIVTTVQWAWDAGAQQWRRSQDGGVHNDAAGAQVTTSNVVVQFVTYRDTGYKDQSGAPVPEAELTGEGEAWVLSDGQVIKGRWRKPTTESVTQYVDGAGQPISVSSGRTWIELPKPGAASLV